MKYRLGRSHQDIVYRQLGDEPRDEDPRVAVFTEAIDAIRVVQLLNGDEDEPGCPSCGTILNAKAAGCAHLWHHDNRPAPERCDQPGEHEPHDYDVDAPAGQWRHCDDPAPADKPVPDDVLDAIMDTIDSYPGPVADRTREHVRRLIEEYAADQHEAGIAEGRRLATEERTDGGPVRGR